MTSPLQWPDVILIGVVAALAVYVIALCFIDDCTHDDQGGNDDSD